MTAPKSDAPLPKPKKTEHLATLLIYAAAMLLAEEMEHAVTLAVPMPAEANIGKTWYDAKG